MASTIIVKKSRATFVDERDERRFDAAQRVADLMEAGADRAEIAAAIAELEALDA